MSDYGTRAYVALADCKILMDEFKIYKNKAIRSCLYGITTVNNTRLFDLDATDFIVKFCYNKIHEVEFVKYREEVG